MGKSELTCDCEIIHGETVKTVKSKKLKDDTLFSIADFYKAIADSTRVRIIHALTISKLCVCDISALLDMTKSAISHQLKYLKEENIVKGEKCGKEVFYSLSDDHVKKIFEISLEHVMEQEND